MVSMFKEACCLEGLGAMAVVVNVNVSRAHQTFGCYYGDTAVHGEYLVIGHRACNQGCLVSSECCTTFLTAALNAMYPLLGRARFKSLAKPSFIGYPQNCQDILPDCVAHRVVCILYERFVPAGKGVVLRH